jgi:DNA-binding transcriptional LysR family regulator
MVFDILKLQAFLAVANGLSMAHAAQQLHVNQSTVSYHIKMLEQSLQRELFDRSGGHLRLTEAGRLLLPRAKKLLHEAASTQQLLESLNATLAGNLRIACSASSSKYVLPLLAARFQEQHPEHTISILVCRPHQVQPQLLLKEAELGVISYEASGEDYEWQPFFTDHLVLIVPAQHPLAAYSAIDPSDLLSVPHIIRESGAGSRQQLLTALGQFAITLEDLPIFLELNSADAIIKTVESGFGVAFVSRLAAQWALELGRVVSLPVNGIRLYQTIYMIRHSLRNSNRAGKAFWNFIHQKGNSDLLALAST